MGEQGGRRDDHGQAVRRQRRRRHRPVRDERRHGTRPRDYQSSTGTLTFDSSGPGATTQTFTVPIVGNGLPDGNRTVNLTLHTVTGGATLGTQKTAVLTIVDDEIVLPVQPAQLQRE